MAFHEKQSRTRSSARLTFDCSNIEVRAWESAQDICDQTCFRLPAIVSGVGQDSQDPSGPQ